ncbi:MAG: hypothetical protein GWN93_16940, partial [Deltaproteobacteria bacterium]|nr:hypothetical protein [Deltaproteobacteria bacterium]
PISITAYWAGLNGLFDDNTAGENTDASDDNWQLVASGAYKAENMDARLTFGYERKPNSDATVAPAVETEDNDLFLIMGEFGMSFDMISFDVIAAINAGEADGTGADSANNRDYEGYMFAGEVDFALDMATISLLGYYVSGDKEGDFDEDFQGFTGQTFSWAE